MTDGLLKARRFGPFAKSASWPPPRGLRLKLMCFSGSSALTATNQRTVTSTLLRGWTWYRRKGVFAPSQGNWSTLRN